MVTGQNLSRHSTQDATAASRDFLGNSHRACLPEDIILHVMFNCDMVCIARMACVCKSFAVAAYHERRARVRRALRPYVPCSRNDIGVAELLLFMDLHAVLVTGSTALRILLGPVLDASNLNLAVPKGEDAVALKLFLQRMGYVLDRDRARRVFHKQLFRGRNRLIHRVWSMIRASDNRAIDIIESVTPYSMDAVLSHPTSLLQNFVSAHFIGCFYPWFTFARQAVLSTLETPNRAVASQLVKYRERGFSLTYGVSFRTRSCGTFCPMLFRPVAHSRTCLMRHSDLTYDSEDHGLTPPVVHAWLAEAEEGRDYRLGSWCNNLHCPHRNV